MIYEFTTGGPEEQNTPAFDKTPEHFTMNSSVKIQRHASAVLNQSHTELSRAYV